MKYKFFNVPLALFLLISVFNCTSKNESEKKYPPPPVTDSQQIVSHSTPDTNKILLNDTDIEKFLKWYLVPGIEILYQNAFLGSYDDNFLKMKTQLEYKYPFLFEGNVSDWEGFLANVELLLKKSNSKYKIIYHITTLPGSRAIPTITIYEYIRTELKTAPIKEMSEFWGIDFRDTFSPQTQFNIEFAKKPLIYRYDLWLHQKRQDFILEGLTFQDKNDIVIFINEKSSLNLEQALMHEFSHKLFDKKTEHIIKNYLERYTIFVEQQFGEARVTITYTYMEFNELMAKLSELIVLPDDKLYEYIHEVSINKTPQYQKLRQLIASTTVYKYLADEHPNEFQKLRTRMITDEEVEKYLLQLSKEYTAKGENKLRSYLNYHVRMVSQNLTEVIFK